MAFAVVVAAVTAVVISSLLLTSATAQTAPEGVQAVDAMAESSLVYVQVNWRGWVVLSDDLYVPPSSTEYYPKGTWGPYTAVTSCSGFVASSTGDIITAGHCVDAQSFDGGKGAIIAAMPAYWNNADGTPLSPAQKARDTVALRQNAVVEGREASSPVERTVRITVPAVSAKKYFANVVDVQPFKQGDVALLRATGVLTPVLPVAQTQPVNGDSVVAAGYSGSVTQVVDAKAAASFKTGEVSGSQTVSGTPFTEFSAAVSEGMSGGPVLNMNGEVVGTVSWYPSGTTSFNFMTDTGSIRSLLAGNGVTTTPSEADQAYRQGLAYYFQRQYHNAVTQFDQALALQPGHMARQYRQKVIANYPNDVAPPSSGLPLWEYGAIGMTLLVVAGGAGFLVIRRRRRARPSLEPAMPMAQPGAPGAAEPAAPMRRPVEESAASGERPAAPVADTARPQPMPHRQQVVEGVIRPRSSEEEDVYCPSCGARHTRDARFCEKCGQPVTAGSLVGHGTNGKVSS